MVSLVAITNTDSIATVSAYQLQLLKDNANTLGIQDVFDGDQKLIPRTPAVCIVMGSKFRRLAGAPLRTDNNFTMHFMVYHSRIQDVQSNYRDVVILAEAIERVLHGDLQMGGYIVQGWVTAVEPGLSVKEDGKSLLRSARITWEGLTRTIVPLS